VKEERVLCAESFRFSREINVKDWIDEGTLSLYYLRLGYVAQRSVILPAIRSLCGCCAEWCADIHPFHCWLRIVRTMGAGACLSALM